MAAVGVDIGGVLIARSGEDDDTSFFSDRYLETPEVPRAFEGLARLTELYGEEVFLVSKCGRRTERRTREWLRAHDLEARTGVSPWRLWFCRERAEKADIAGVLHLTAFVDDRLDVLGALGRKVRTRVLLDPIEAELEPHLEHLGRVERVDGWADALPILAAAAGAPAVGRASPP